MEKVITYLSLPFLLLHLLVRFCGKSKHLYEQDQMFNLHHRSNPFTNTLLQFAYYIVWLPEYRSVFYRRAGLIGKIMNIYFRGQKCLYIRTVQLGGVFV